MSSIATLVSRIRLLNQARAEAEADEMEHFASQLAREVEETEQEIQEVRQCRTSYQNEESDFFQPTAHTYQSLVPRMLAS